MRTISNDTKEEKNRNAKQEKKNESGEVKIKNGKKSKTT
jgi:hypothetical protein